MTGNSTREKILDQALTLFAGYGFKAVTVAQIAAAVGIKAPSLYKHFKSKQELFDALVTELSRRYDLVVQEFNIDGTNALNDRERFARMDCDTIVEVGRRMFHYFLHDSFAVRFRKMLTIEQFGNEQLSARYVKQYIDDSLSYQTILFSFFIEKGLFVQGIAADVAALEFYGPIFLLLTMCTAQPSREKQAAVLVEEHIRQFMTAYRQQSGIPSAAAGQ